ncbi:MAG TPA: beta-propeller fold lactonase family protein [bacterium]|nr:beta-propeller fold lactonase family protein [bacterium]
MRPAAVNRRSRGPVLLAGMIGAALAVSGCGSHAGVTSGPSGRSPAPAARPAPAEPDNRRNVYSGAMSTHVSTELAGIPERVYVPNELGRSVDVIDPSSGKVTDHFPVGREPEHITPSWDMTRLYVNNTMSNTLTEIDPLSGKPVKTIPVPDPYNLYFTPDGTKAIVVAERFNRLDFRDPKTWKLLKSVPIPWSGVDHMDFSADGGYLMASTEYSGFVVKVDTRQLSYVGQVNVGGLPIDVRLSPDGSVFYVANQGRHGVSVIDPLAMKEIEFISTGHGAHGLVVSRDTKSLYVSNRLEGTISVIDTATRRVREKWAVGGSPDMMQISPDGQQLWVSNRFHASVTVIDTVTGEVLQRIKTGANPHGLALFPQPGRMSVGHNGVYR